MLLPRFAFALIALSISATAAPDAEGIDWLVEYHGGALPAAPWKADGLMKVEPGAESLHLSDESHEGFGFFRAPWKAELGADREIVVEARVKLRAMTGGNKAKEAATMLWPWRDGAPVGLMVSDGVHYEGLAMRLKNISTFTDRMVEMDPMGDFHTYRLVIRGTDMSIAVDGQPRIHGQNAFWKAAPSAEPFIQFGSNARYATGDAEWAFVRLGVRKAAAPAEKNPLKVTISEPWPIPRDINPKQTRPYLYDMGKGLLLMSVAQGPDARDEPYGILKSTDAGKTWTPIEGLDLVDFAPIPMLRLRDGSIFASSRWTHSREDGALLGTTIHLDAAAEHFTREENVTRVPDKFTPKAGGDVLIFERHIFQEPQGSILAVCWTRQPTRVDGHAIGNRSAHFLRTTDLGKTWNHVTRIGPGGEPAVAYLSPSEAVAVIRADTQLGMNEVFSHDGGLTWSEPTVLEEGIVAPDLVAMSNGVLACSYGRPSSCLMFSVDGGKTWCSHHVISDKTGFNYTSIREISPGRLLYVHDGGGLQAVYVDVERE